MGKQTTTTQPAKPDIRSTPRENRPQKPVKK
jgi:hypothetical protein